MLVRESKYQIVSRRTSESVGTLVDIGARNNHLRGFLSPELRYISADIAPGHDMLWDLEEPISVPDCSYDTVVAIDVLEHVEHIHRAYKELIRIARHKLFVSLPNMTCLPWRLQFLKTRYPRAKYDLLSERQGDRHRWLTSDSRTIALVNHRAQAIGCTVKLYSLLSGHGRHYVLVVYLPLPPALRAYAVLFEITKSQACTLKRFSP